MEHHRGMEHRGATPDRTVDHNQAAMADHRGVGHHHDGHGHPIDPGADRRWLLAALALICAFMAGEVVVGIVAQSIALLSDAAHMLTDVVSLALALIAMRLAARPPRGGYTYGLRRAEILSAQANGLTLLLFAAWLAVEAIRRLVSPADVAGGPVLATALVGIVVNVGATAMVSRASRRSLNIEGAYQHILTDLFAFIATAIAGAVILASGWTRADPIASLVVVALMARAGLGLVRASGRILLEAAPTGLEPDRVGRDMLSVEGVVEVHDLHVWEITSGAPALSAHVIVRPTLDCHALRVELERLLRDRYGLTHTTLQVDHAEPELHRIGRAATR